MAFKWYTANDGGVHGGDDGSAVEFEIEAPRKRGGQTSGFFFSNNSPTYHRFLVGHDEIRGTVGQIKKRANEEMAKAVELEMSAPPPARRSSSGGTGRALFWGSLAALGGVAAWKLTNDK
jgi:hypothetical protein